MVFSSFPAIYLDHPNLQQFQQQQQQQQQQDHHHQLGSGLENSQIQLPQPSVSQTVVGGALKSGGSSIRPGSMVDRARMAKLPLPEAGLKCPRCDSTNTKFCYFNNYSLSQPRHFCKTCRRYWTRNGALRNVPVGGGCRRNKKSKTTTSKSTNSDTRQVGPNSTTSTAPCPSNGTTTDMNMATNYPQQGTQIPLMAALHNLNHYAGGPIGSNLGGFQANMGFSLGNHFGGGNNVNDLPASGTPEPWRLPPIGGFEQLTSNLFPFQGEGIEASSSMIGEQEPNVKSEGSQATNMTKQFHINSDNGQGQYWNGNIPWTGFSGLSSSSASHLL